MIIRIDFNNTIASYDNVFYENAIKLSLIDRHFKDKNKNKIKNFIISKKNNMKKWQELQGLTYGKYMHNASVMPGFINFVKLCQYNNIKLFIVSHKTIYGHHDSNKVLLRNKAMKWMEKNNFFEKKYFNFFKDQIFFESSIAWGYGPHYVIPAKF